ncbi:MAG: adenylate/guanylate cyclase domain-containing protein [Leptospirales bacterium]
MFKSIWKKIVIPWNYLTKGNIDAKEEPREKKTYYLTNRILVLASFYIATGFIVMFFKSNMDLQNTEFMQAITLVGPMFPLFAITLIINHLGFHRIAKLLFILGGNIYLLYNFALYGGLNGSDSFYFLFYFSPLLLFTARDKGLIFFCMLVSVSLYALIQINIELLPQYQMEGIKLEDMPTYELMNTLFTFLLSGAMIYFFFKETIQAEDAYAVEKRHAETLLLNILPREIADRLQSGDKIIADKIESASVIFADIEGFTKLTSGVDAEQLVTRLNRLFSEFDDCAEKYNVEKIKTIGDSYMAVAGVPIKSEPEEHATNALLMAKEMIEIFNAWALSNNWVLKIRVGIHTGSMVAGVIGKKKFVYDLWGHTVNMASRLENQGIPGSIQLSKETYMLINELIKQKFNFSQRKNVPLKGTENVDTYIMAI